MYPYYFDAPSTQQAIEIGPGMFQDSPKATPPSLKEKWECESQR